MNPLISDSRFPYDSTMLTWKDVLEVEETQDRRKFGIMCPDIAIYRQGRALILDIPGEEFRVLSSGFTNGGYMESPQAVMNISGIGGKAEYSCMLGGLEEFDRSVEAYVKKLGYEPDRCVCMTTAANMDNAILTEVVSSDGIRVSTVITGGIRHNGGRAGDPTTYDEAAHVGNEKSGTIIILMSIDADLSESSMLASLTMATEAKSCVVQELQARSLYTPDIATGSGTDQVAVISHKGSDVMVETLLRDSPLAVAISECVSKGLRLALAKQSGMDVELQSDVMTVLSRYNLVQDSIREEMRFSASMDELMAALEDVRRDKYLASMAMGVLHIQDDIRNGRVSEDEGLCAAKTICRSAVLDGSLSPLEDLRFESSEDIVELVSYVSALKLIRRVEERRGH